MKKAKHGKNAERKAKRREGNDCHRTPLASIKKQGSALVPQRAEMGVQVTTWDRDLLPEHLWVAARERLVSRESEIYSPYYALMDVLRG